MSTRKLAVHSDLSFQSPRLGRLGLRCQSQLCQKPPRHVVRRERCIAATAATSQHNPKGVGHSLDAGIIQRSEKLPLPTQHKVSLLQKVGALADIWPVRSMRHSLQQMSLGRTSQATKHTSASVCHAASSLQLPSTIDTQTTLSTGGSGDVILHPTLEVIKERALSGSLPGQRSDSYKLGLVVEGGGMRGVVTGAMLLALQVLKVSNTFDCVYGASAGAINSTYYLAQQAEGLDIYTEDIANTKFLNLKRLVGPRPVMDLDFLVDHIMHNVKPLDWDAVLESPVPLKVVASSLDSLDSIVLSDFTDRTDLVECLKASANVPQIAGSYREWRGHRLVDAAVFEPLPYRSALADGCTHVLVLRSRAAATPVHPIQGSLESAITMALKQTLLNPPYMRDAWKAELELVKSCGGQLDEMLAMTVEGNNVDTADMPLSRVLPIYPAQPDTSFHPLCIDVPKLQRGREAGFRAVHEALGPIWASSTSAELVAQTC